MIFLNQVFKKVQFGDSKNINNVINCNYSLDWLKKNNKNYLSALVETPTSSIKKINNDKWKNCIQDINSQTNVSGLLYANYFAKKL